MVSLESKHGKLSSGKVPRMVWAAPSSSWALWGLLCVGVLGIIGVVWRRRAHLRGAIQEWLREKKDPERRHCHQCDQEIPRAWNPCRYCAAEGYPARLILLDGAEDEVGRVFFVMHEVTTIGRSTKNQLMLDRPGISERHAGIQVVNGRFDLADYGSLNGTFIDGARVNRHYLRDGDQVMFGPVRMKFRLGHRP